MHVSARQRLGIVAIVLPAMLVVAMGILYRAEFTQLFQDFDAELPALTQFAYDWYVCSLAFTVLVAPYLWLTSPASGQSRLRSLGWPALVVALVAYAMWITVMAIGMYLPFHKVAAID